ncbi:MAG: DUF2098 domain-containing protein [Methanotrichaceae archaeon]
MTNEIKEGSVVRYSGTGTTGVVKVLKTEDDGKWAFLDTTGLYYHVNTLELIDRMPERKEMRGRTLEEFEKLMKEEKEQLTKIAMREEECETGGG